MKRNLVGKILGKIKIFVQDFVPIRTALRAVRSRKALWDRLIAAYPHHRETTTKMLCPSRYFYRMLQRVCCTVLCTGDSTAVHQADGESSPCRFYRRKNCVTIFGICMLSGGKGTIFGRWFYSPKYSSFEFHFGGETAWLVAPDVALRCVLDSFLFFRAGVYSGKFLISSSSSAQLLTCKCLNFQKLEPQFLNYEFLNMCRVL